MKMDHMIAQFTPPPPECDCSVVNRKEIKLGPHQYEATHEAVPPGSQTVAPSSPKSSCGDFVLQYRLLGTGSFVVGLFGCSPNRFALPRNESKTISYQGQGETANALSCHCLMRCVASYWCGPSFIHIFGAAVRLPSRL
ncbi:hypothetical protein V9T40_014920 [Parthenolecanium corni]|uniref:Uncharacterized protein n=1 Tax=Parthenolecanium corni TaxID=536013 RepID=A0AAN9Y5C2_9HEMI